MAQPERDPRERHAELAVGAEGDVAHDGLEGVIAHIVGELVLIEPVRAFDRIGQDGHVGIGPRRQVIAERIDPGGGGLGLVLLQEIEHAGELLAVHIETQATQDGTPSPDWP